MRNTRLIEPYTNLAQQQYAAVLGIWTFLATEVLFFGGLILAYAVYRYRYSADFALAARHTRLVIGTANTAILLTSSFLVAWAVAAIKLGAGRVTSVLLGGAAALGLLFLILKGIEYSGEIKDGLFPGAHFVLSPLGTRLFFIFYFIVTGLHALHVAIGIAALGIVSLKARGGAYSQRYSSPVTVVALYWHFVDLVWIFLFALIYLPGRS